MRGEKIFFEVSKALVASYLGFAHLCALASLREHTFSRRNFHAKVLSRNEKPQS